MSDFPCCEPSTAASPVSNIVPALRGLTRFSRAEGVKPHRWQLRTWVKAVLADYAHRGLEIVELKGALATEHGHVERLKAANEALADDDRPTVAEWDALKANYERSQEIARGLIFERDEARASADSRAERLLSALDEVEKLRAELALVRETSGVRADYILLRLRDGLPEVVPVSNWEETDDGGVTVEGVASSGVDV